MCGPVSSFCVPHRAPVFHAGFWACDLLCGRSWEDLSRAYIRSRQAPAYTATGCPSQKNPKVFAS